MKKQFLFILLASSSLIFLSFQEDFFFWSFSKERKAPEFNPNVGLPMCRVGGALFQFDVLKDGKTPLAPKFEGLGDLHFEITTSSPEAQDFFDQGYQLVYAFNHAEALRSFQEAARLDPNCAMAYWGQALAVGPNINDPLPDQERQRQAYEAIQKAKQLQDNVTAEEASLIEALVARCSAQESDQESLNKAYHEAMNKTYQSHPDHPEIGTLYADAIMNTMPWDYWDAEHKAKPNTEACVDALKKVIKNYPNHPGAHHLFIHIIEAVDPDQAENTADILRYLMPGAGHIVHMPAHIYIGIGRYADAADCNKTAIQADEDYIAACQAQGMYPLAYYPHNLHFLWAAESMLGNSQGAIEAAKKLADKVPVQQADELHFIQDFMAVPIQAYVRFGKWNEILTTPLPDENLLHVSMMTHYARGMAFVRKNMITSAKQELEAVNKIMNDPASEDILAAYMNPTNQVAKIASESLAGEIAAAEGDHEMAIKHLSAAVKFEDQLAYQEPAAWHAPTRQYLGAVLVTSGKMEAAESVFKEDLAKNRANGWSLFGLHQSLVAQGKTEEAAQVNKQFTKSWQRADIPLTASRL